MLKFTKMHGLGNDFMVIDTIDQKAAISKQVIQQWADRHTGVGFDQLLIIEKTPQSLPQFAYKIYNADGSSAEQCGNGACCIARYLLDRGWVKQRQFALQAPTGQIIVTEKECGQISVELGQPCFEHEKIPFMSSQILEDHQYSLTLSEQKVTLNVLSMGNPHAVMFVPEITAAPIDTIGQEIAKNEAFPQGVNVEFVQILSKNAIQIRVLERGVGETLACGSGACAAMVAGRLSQQLDENVTVTLPGGQLIIKWPGLGQPVTMTGPANTVYHGEIA